MFSLLLLHQTTINYKKYIISQQGIKLKAPQPNNVLEFCWVWLFHLPSFSYCLSLSPCILFYLLTLRFLRILRVIFPLLIVLVVRKIEAIGYWLLFRSLRDYASSNSMGVKKCRVYLSGASWIFKLLIYYTCFIKLRHSLF